MDYANPYIVANAEASERSAFIRRTYIHLALAIAAFAGLEWFLIQQTWAQNLAVTMSQNWLIVMLAFMGFSSLADRWAQSATSQGIQYVGLGVSIVIWSIIFLPMIIVAQQIEVTEGASIIQPAALTTAGLVGALTLVAFLSGADFSFLRGFIVVASFVALGIIVVSILFGFTLGILFSGAMVLLASASILYTTSSVIHHYGTNQYVAASVALFAGVALMFWYILRIFMSRR